MRILHVFDHSIPLQSGYTFRSRAIIEQQRRFGWQTFHITSAKQGESMALEETVDGLIFYRVPANLGAPSKIEILNHIKIVATLERRMAELIQEISPDIIHAHSPALNGLAAVKVGHRYNIPVIYEIRAFWEDAAVDHGTAKIGGLRYRMSRMLEMYVARRSKAVTTICAGLKDDLVNRGIPQDKITVIPNAVDPSKFDYGRPKDLALLARLGLKNGAVLGFIGSFYAYEGLPLLLGALPIVARTIPDVRLVLIGGGPQKEALRQLVTKLGIENRVLFIGRISHDEIQSYYNLMDILVYPRLSMRLTNLVTPLKPLEGMAQGRLIVASDVGGHRELIRHNETGLLFRAGDADHLSEIILQAFQNHQMCDRIRMAARQFVEAERNWEVSVARYKPIYERAIDGRY